MQDVDRSMYHRSAHEGQLHVSGRYLAGGSQSEASIDEMILKELHSVGALHAIQKRSVAAAGTFCYIVEYCNIDSVPLAQSKLLNLFKHVRTY